MLSFLLKTILQSCPLLNSLCEVIKSSYFETKKSKEPYGHYWNEWKTRITQNISLERLLWVSARSWRRHPHPLLFRFKPWLLPLVLATAPPWQEALRRGQKLKSRPSFPAPRTSLFWGKRKVCRHSPRVLSTCSLLSGKWRQVMNITRCIDKFRTSVRIFFA